MKIYIASDHAGFKLKEQLTIYIKGEFGHEVYNKGALVYDEKDDYPDFISLVAQEVNKNPEDALGIVIGGSGQGEAIVANRFKGVRAVVCYDYNPEIIKLSREHNDANILSLGARFLSEDEAKKTVKQWLETPFPKEERHLRRINKIDSLINNS